MTDHARSNPSRSNPSRSNPSRFYMLLQKTKKAAYARLENIALNNKGIIYGGYVRDVMIAEEHARRFNMQHQESSDKFWDKSFSPETRGRLLIPNDMDICFYSVEEADYFIASLRQVTEFSDVVSSMYHNYYSANISCVQHVLIYIKKIGYVPFVNPGATIIIQIDVVIPKVNIEPPFNNLDMLCNGFIMLQPDNTLRAVKYSSNTGTVLDDYTNVQKMQVVSGIVNDLVEFKTHLCFSSVYAPTRTDFNIMCMRRVMKMYNKTIPWTMYNSPIQVTTQNAEATHECCICCSPIENGESMIQSISKKSNDEEIVGSRMHYKCGMDYFYHEKHKDPDESGVIVLTCPFRVPIDFRGHASNLNNIYL